MLTILQDQKIQFKLTKIADDEINWEALKRLLKTKKTENPTALLDFETSEKRVDGWFKSRSY